MNKKQRLVLIVSIMASVVAAIDGFIVNVALPTISRQLGGGLATQQWTIDAYLITLGALILVAGSLSDLFGRKRVLMVGLVWFGVASLLCAMAPNSLFLIVSRALQGIGGALLVPSSLAIIISSFKGEAQGKAIGAWTAWLSVATVIGPLLGGLIVAVASWRWIFAVNVLPIALTVILLVRLPVDPAVKKGTSIDTLGALLCATGLGAPVFGLIEQPNDGWASPLVYGSIGIGVVLLAVFVWYESRNKAPMLPLSLFRSRNFSAGNLATLAIYAGLSVSTFLITITLQQVGGYSALRAGFALLPVSIIMFLLSKRFGALAGRFGPRLFMTLGPLVVAAGFVLMLRVQTQVRYLVDMLPAVILFGIGLSITVAPLTSAVLAGVQSKYAGVASAVNNAVARIAGLVAVALVGVITGPHLTIAGFHRTLVVVALLLVIGGLVSWLGIRNAARPVALETEV